MTGSRTIIVCEACGSSDVSKSGARNITRDADDEHSNWYCKDCQEAVETVRREPNSHGSSRHGLAKQLVDADDVGDVGGDREVRP